MDLKLGGRVALVAGASRGIGRAVALALAREGADVAVMGRTRAGLEETAASVRALGRYASVLCADVSDVAAVDAQLSEFKKASAAPSLFVWSVAALWAPGRLERQDDEAIARGLTEDLTACAWLCKRLLGDMAAARFGRIVALSSAAAESGIPGGAMYAAGKAGLEGLMRSIALDYGKRGVTANSVQLGFVDTERLAARLSHAPEGQRQNLIDSAAIGRLLSPEEVADAVAFLCSPNAGGITGSTLRLTGGAHLNTRW